MIDESRNNRKLGAGRIADRRAVLRRRGQDQVVIGEQTWTGATAIQYVLKVILEKYLDADVGSIAAGEPVLWEAMDRGDGSVDVLPDVWSEHLPEQLNKYVVPGSRETVILNNKPYLGREGIYVPGYVQDQYGIKKVTDLADARQGQAVRLRW